MRLLIDLCHPADVHFFFNIAQKLKKKGNLIIYTARDKDVLLQLCNEYGLKYNLVGDYSESLVGKFFKFVIRCIKLANIVKQNKIDKLIGFGNPYVVATSMLCGKKSLFVTDTEDSKWVNLIGFYASLTLLTNWSNLKPNKRVIQLPWLKEMSYINPSTEDHIKKQILVRKVAWTASHDYKHKGITNINLLRKGLKDYKFIIIREQENNYKENPLKSKKDYIDLLSISSLVITEGATTAAEAALLGTHTIYTNSQKPGYIKELINRGIIYEAKSDYDIIIIAKKLLKKKLDYNEKIEKLRAECVDITDFTSRLINKL